MNDQWIEFGRFYRNMETDVVRRGWFWFAENVDVEMLEPVEVEYSNSLLAWVAVDDRSSGDEK